jgi:hypothetical protein
MQHTTQSPAFWQHHLTEGLFIHETDDGFWVMTWDGSEGHDLNGASSEPFATLAEAEAFAQECIDQGFGQSRETYV